MNIFFAILEQSLTLTPLVLGMFLSYRILKITDLTVDGTYVLGAAIFARFVDVGLFQAVGLASLAGAIVGVIVAFMQRNNVVNDLISGVLASFMLYSVNLQIMGRPNISTLDAQTFLSFFNFEIWSIPFGIITIILFIILYILLNSKLGLTLRAFGFNQKLLRTLGKSPEKYRMLGLATSNALAALSGALASQINGFTDINMGLGIALVGIGAVVIGRQLIIKNNKQFLPIRELTSCFLGIFLYYAALSLLLRFGINPVNLKLILGIVLFIALSGFYKRGYV